jgi:uncharacterized protein DUF6194
MDATEMTAYICHTFAGVETATAHGYSFFFFGADRQLPFATLAAADNEHDRVSNLERPGVYRLNIGVARETFRSLFGPETPRLGSAGIIDTDHDFSALNQVLPHPHYAPQSWVCVLNPKGDTLQTVQSMLQEAYDRAVDRARRREASKSP